MSSDSYTLTPLYLRFVPSDGVFLPTFKVLLSFIVPLTCFFGVVSLSKVYMCFTLLLLLLGKPHWGTYHWLGFSCAKIFILVLPFLLGPGLVY